MERIFCKDKKGFCDCIENCRTCEFAKGNGVINGNIAHDVLATLFGLDYDLGRLREMVQADREGRCLKCEKENKNMNAVENQVRELVSVELAAANATFPQFHSPHEGFAVIMEELEETEEDLRLARIDTEIMWINIRKDISCNAEASSLKEKAIHVACEAIQVAAMVQKYLDMEIENA